MTEPLSDQETRTKADEVRALIAADARSNFVTSSTSYSDTSFGPRFPAIEPAAFYGLAGEAVRSIEPYTEADPVAVLGSLLVGFGNAVGSQRYAVAGSVRHPARLNTVLVGETSRSRKGTAWALARTLLADADPTWAKDHVVGGLASGEGLIAAVRDGDADTDVVDKRLLVVEPEFARVLSVAGREGNTLSAIIRHAWDDGFLRTMTRQSPLRASGAHISVLGQVTKEELLRRLSDTEAANGFANRFLFLAVRRSKTLPDGGTPPTEVVEDLSARLREALTAARRLGEMKRTAEAATVWAQMYEEMTDAPPGLVGAVTARPEAQTLRLSVAYALLDASLVLDAEHLHAAYAVWRYAEASARYIFGTATGDDVADRLIPALADAGAEGLDREEIHGLFGRNLRAARLDAALDVLERLGLAVRRAERGLGSRPRIVAYATTKLTRLRSFDEGAE